MPEIASKPRFRPSQIDVSTHLKGCKLRKRDQKTVVRNIILLALWNVDTWFPFKWHDYATRTPHSVTEAERRALEELARLGYLTVIRGYNNVNDKFMDMVAPFVKTKT